jgi:hypothetical protein
MNIFLIALAFFMIAFQGQAQDSTFVVDACEGNPQLIKDSLSLIPEYLQTRTCAPTVDPTHLPEDYLGPNCFMGVLLWLNANEPLRFVDGVEFEKLLSGYNQISREDATYGDIVVFEREDLKMNDVPYNVHAAIYINANLVWNKLGPTKFYDRGNGLTFADPSWTFTNLSALEDKNEIATVKFFHKK